VATVDELAGIGPVHSVTVGKVMDDAAQLHFEAISQWHQWLAASHTQKQGVWLVSWKTRGGRPAIPYEEAVQEALCYGWIDSTYRSLD